MKYTVSSCKEILDKLADDCTNWGQFVVRATDFLNACLNDNDISWWEHNDLCESIHNYWNCFEH